MERGRNRTFKEIGVIIGSEGLPLAFAITAYCFHALKLVTQAGIAPAMIWNPIYREPASCLPSNCTPSLLLFILLRVTVHAAESNWFLPPQKSPEKGPKACALLRFLGRNGMEPLPSLGQHRHGKKLSKIKIWMSLHQSRLKGLAFILRSFCAEQALAGSRKNSYVPLLAECDYGFGEITSSRFCCPGSPKLCVTSGWANWDQTSNRLRF